MKINNKLLKPSHIILDVNVKNQKEALTKIAELALSLGYITDCDELITAFLKREEPSTTGFEDGIAIPHVRLKTIKVPAILILRTNNSVNWKAIDGQLTNIIIALIIPEKHAKTLHLDILSALAIKLTKQEFCHNLKTAVSTNDLIAFINDDVANTKTVSQVKIKTKIVGVSSCTTGVVHTYMCKKLLEKSGQELGYQVHIECQGQKGPEYVLTEQEIKEADVVILATDVAIELDRFANKKTYTCSTRAVVKDAKQVITNSLQQAKSSTVDDKKEYNSDFILNASKSKPEQSYLKTFIKWCILYDSFCGFSWFNFGYY